MNKDAGRRPNAQDTGVKPYATPTLSKGPVLSDISALQLSGKQGG